MKQTLNIKDHMIELIVATFFIAAMVVLIYFTMVISRDAFSKDSYTVTIKFPEVASLETGNKVLLRGMEVGAVKKLELADDGVLVSVAVSDGVRIFKDCSVEIEASSVLGGNLVSIKQGTVAAGVVTSADMLTGHANNGLMTEASSVLEELRNDGMFDDLSATMKNFKDISSKISKGEGTLGKLINDDEFYSDAKELVAELKKAGTSVSSAAGDISTLVGDAQKIIDDLKKDITEAVANIKEFTETINNKDSSIAKLFSDNGDLYAKLDKSLSELKTVSEKLNSTDGTLGKLINDPAVFDDVRSTFAEVKDTFTEVKGAVQDYRESSTISTFGSLIFGAL